MNLDLIMSLTIQLGGEFVKFTFSLGVSKNGVVLVTDIELIGLDWSSIHFD